MFDGAFIGMPFGCELIESREMVDRVTKVYKTTRKWKRHGIHRITTVAPKKDVFVVGQRIIGHPFTIAKIKQSIPYFVQHV